MTRNLQVEIFVYTNKISEYKIYSFMNTCPFFFSLYKEVFFFQTRAFEAPQAHVCTHQNF